MKSSVGNKKIVNKKDLKKMVNYHRWGGPYSSSVWPAGADPYDHYPSAPSSSVLWHGSVDDAFSIPNRYYPYMPYYYYRHLLPSFSSSSSSNLRRGSGDGGRLKRSNSLSSIASLDSDSNYSLDETTKDRYERACLDMDPLSVHLSLAKRDQKIDHLKGKLNKTKKECKKQYEHIVVDSVRTNNYLHANLCAQKDISKDVHTENEMLRTRLAQIESQNATLLNRNHELAQQKEISDDWAERWHDRAQTLSRLVISFNTMLHEKDGKTQNSLDKEKLANLLSESRVKIVGSRETEIESVDKSLEDESKNSIASLHHKLLQEMLKVEHDKWLPPYKNRKRLQEEDEMIKQQRDTIQQLEQKIKQLQEQVKREQSNSINLQTVAKKQERTISELFSHINEADKMRLDREETILKLQQENDNLLNSVASKTLPTRRKSSYLSKPITTSIL
ncbi:predicted protein [Naegleria gruberi]|uniref:Predicted protein n=1 Tax=Naegleria gruberi TaxID=5762 RepID=D2VVT4_NAEGR|nr:uncharacterized protein NAEGRDRAFT_52662 [Naegleria gruberi]EFC39162.1 predicted protein [Naegleria gruberi]|eukprot:XP_002671906.1 predicted protein [Naegleria gruberi strain NEG-M]